MKNIKKIVFITTILVAIGTGNLFARSKKTIVVGSANGGGSRLFQGLIAVAKEAGLIDDEFKKLGYKTEYQTFENGIAVNEAFLANEVDFAYIGDVPGITGLSNNVGSVWIGSDLGISTLGIAVHPSSSARKAEDFIGKNIAVNIGTNAHLLYGKYFEAAGIKPSQFNTANHTLANAALAVVTGNADAAIGDVTVLIPLEKKGDLKIIFTTLEKPEWASQLLLLGNKKLLKKNPELGVAFLKAIIRARLLIEKNPDTYYGIISANALANDLETAKKLFNSDGKFEALNPEITESSISRAQSLDDYFYSIGRLNAKKDVKTFIDTSYYEKAAKELGIGKF